MSHWMHVAARVVVWVVGILFLAGLPTPARADHTADGIAYLEMESGSSMQLEYWYDGIAVPIPPIGSIERYWSSDPAALTVTPSQVVTTGASSTWITVTAAVVNTPRVVTISNSLEVPGGPVSAAALEYSITIHPPRALISASTFRLDFGRIVELSGPRTLSFDIGNVGTANLSYSLALGGSPSYWTISPSSGTLAPGATRRVDVTFDNNQRPVGIHTNTLVITSNDPDHPTWTIRISTEVTLTPPSASLSVTSLAFGNVAMGETRDLAITISNSGHQALNFSITAPGGPWSASQLVGSVRPSSSFGVNIRFSAVGRLPGRTYSTTLTIHTNDPQQPTLLVAVSGSVVNPAWMVLGGLTASGTLQFGNVAVGRSATASIEVRNEGEVPLTVQYSVTGNPQGPAIFTVTGLPSPLTIQPRSATNLTVTFRPQAAGSPSAYLNLVTNDPSQLTYTVLLTGEVTAVPHMTLLGANGPQGNTLPLSARLERSHTVSISVLNDGAAGSILTVSVSITQQPADQPYSVRFLEAGGRNASIAAGDSDQILVTFSPMTTGPLSANLNLATNDPAAGSRTIGLAGEGISNGDEFVSRVLLYFYPSLSQPAVITEEWRRFAAVLVNELAASSAALSWIPRPPLGRASPLWLFTQIEGVIWREIERRLGLGTDNYRILVGAVARNWRRVYDDLYNTGSSVGLPR